MSSTDGSTELFPVRNPLYLGDYGRALSKGNTITVSNDKRVEQDTLMYRAHIGLGQYDLVISAVEDKPSTPMPLQAVRILAQYLKTRDFNAAQDKTQSLLSQELAKDPTLLVVASTIYMHEGQDQEALKLLYNPSTLEVASLQVRALLRINRTDLAELALKKMTELNDEATITKLTNAYVCLAKGGQANIEEARVLFQELSEKFEDTSVLLNGLALCHMQSGEYEEAEKLLAQALSKSPNDPDTLVNMIVVEQHIQQRGGHAANNASQRKFAQMRALNPHHYWVEDVVKADREFDELMQKYTVEKVSE
ncbi:coatomer subunit epsilon [Acrasis kona]|uniref:Coatomer subunit epsilon n=1 Tax=Acrasis kona TaxID=1008807 RepID=A0AAW2Z1A1_9EUKA